MAVTADQLRRPSAHPAEETTWFETAFEEHWPRVVAVLYRIVAEQAEAEEKRRQRPAGTQHPMAPPSGPTAAPAGRPAGTGLPQQGPSGMPPAPPRTR